MKNFITNLKYFFKRFVFLKVLNSPFKPFKIRTYFGKIKHGTPYFLPRRWIKMDRFHAEQYAREEMEKMTNVHKEKFGWKRIEESFEDLVQEGLRRMRAVPKKIGFDFVPLTWKTKWSDTDIRYEWGPMWSFVFLKWQFCLHFQPEYVDNYWESWIYYNYHTDKSKSKDERIRECIENFSQTYKRFSKDREEIINYYSLILKDKYLKYINSDNIT